MCKLAGILSILVVALCLASGFKVQSDFNIAADPPNMFTPSTSCPSIANTPYMNVGGCPKCGAPDCKLTAGSNVTLLSKFFPTTTLNGQQADYTITMGILLSLPQQAIFTTVCSANEECRVEISQQIPASALKGDYSLDLMITEGGESAKQVCQKGCGFAIV